MKRLDYLKLALREGYFNKRPWMIAAFAISKASEQNKAPGAIIPQAWGFDVVLPDGTQEKIDDAKANQPLFYFKERVQVDNSWAPNIAQPSETSVGNLFFNAIAILTSFGKKFPYQYGPLSVGGIEEQVAPKLMDTPAPGQERSEGNFYVDEYLKFQDARQYLESLSQLITIAVTRRSVLPPTGRDKFKTDLLKQYEGKLTDPLELAKFEKTMADFDSDYLKGDPSDGTFVKGKIKNVARKKLFLNVGADVSFSNSSKVTPIMNSLDQGWATEPEQFTASMNGLRAGSYSRGSETVKGGVSAKILIRSASNYKIIDTDCGTTLGIQRQYNNPNEAKYLIGRYLVQGTQSVLVKKEDAGNYLGKVLAVRSPMYCRLKGETLCKVCAGTKLSQYPQGLVIPLTEVSAIILTAALKKMHQNNLAVSTMDFKSTLS